MFSFNRWRKPGLIYVLAAGLAAVLACSSGTSDPEAEATVDGVTPGGGPNGTTQPSTSTGTPDTPPDFLSEIALPTRELEFRVRVPENHPAGDRVVLMTMPPGNVISLDRVELEQDSSDPRLFTGKADVEQGALLRYTYDRWDGIDISGWDAHRETIEDVYAFINRYVLVTDEIDGVDDTVALWRDVPGPEHDGAVSGTVLDSVTGDPVIDATVSISGIHVATDWLGKFRVKNLPDGEHRAIVFTTLGDYRAKQAEFEIVSGASGEINFSLDPAARVPVTFDVGLPDTTPNDAEIALAGNLWQLGGRLYQYPFQPDAMSLPVLDRHGSSRATVTLDLYEGTYVKYTYTIRSIAEGSDQSNSGPVFRSFIVDPAEQTRSDLVDRWHRADWPIVTMRVTVPTNTTPGVPVGISTGPTAWMSQTGPFEWVAHFLYLPPGSETEFGITLGDDFAGRDGSPGAVEGRRTVTVPEDGSEIALTVTKWERSPDPTLRQDDGGLDVTFRLSVPPETPSDATILLSGNRAATSGPIEMTQRSDNPWVYETTVNFGHDGDLSYQYELDGVGESTRTYDVFTGFDGQLVSDWVGEWEGLSPPDDSGRATWRSGIYVPDFWSASFINNSPSTFDRITSSAQGEWVALSSVWSFGQLQPVPMVEQRALQIWSVLTPLENIKAQAALAHEKGLNVFLAPQQNPEVLPGWNDAPLNVWDQAWWEAWLPEAERQWMWNALLAEEIGAEMLMLPGPVFHVFPNAVQSDDDPFQQVLDDGVTALIAQVREVYSGLIIMSGNNSNYDFPGLAHIRGVTTYDLGVPALSDDATVAEWKDAYRENFEAKVDPIRERWDGPVMFYTIHAPGTGSGQFGAPAAASDPFGEQIQANRLEAIYQLIEERPWIEGAYSWAYDYIDAPGDLTDGVRGRLGEAVQAKWYERLSGD